MSYGLHGMSLFMDLTLGLGFGYGFGSNLVLFGLWFKKCLNICFS